MNKEMLIRQFPEQFSRKTFSGVLLYLICLCFCLIGFIELTVSVGNLFNKLYMDFSVNIIGIAICVRFANAFYRAAEASMKPLEKSQAIYDIQKAKSLFDEGELDKEEADEYSNVSVDFSSYSLFSLMDSYRHIDKDSYPNNFNSLSLHIRKHITDLSVKGVFS